MKHEYDNKNKGGTEFGPRAAVFRQQRKARTAKEKL